MIFNNLVENRTIFGMDLRNGKSINNFKGMFPIRPTSPPTTFIGATSFAPPFIQLQCLQWAMRILCDLTSSQSTRMPSPDVPARQSNGAVGSTSDYSVSLSALSHSANVYPLYSLIHTHPLSLHRHIRFATRQILSNYLNTTRLNRPVSQWWHILYLHAFPFYSGDIPKQWYFKLNDLMKLFL